MNSPARYQLPPHWERHFQLPPELQRWGWTLQQMKSGPRKHPGGWWQFIFNRWKGLAEGDNDRSHDDPSLQIKVRRTTVEEALVAAITEMLEISTKLAPGDEYIVRLAEFRRWNPPYLWTSSRHSSDTESG